MRTYGFVFIDLSGRLSCLRLALVIATVLPATQRPSAAAEPPDKPPAVSRYVALRTDGKVVKGETLTNWHATASEPRLDSQPLVASEPLHWLRDQHIGPPLSLPAAYVELFGGDLLPGRVTGWGSGDESASAPVPAHLLVDPAEPLLPPDAPPSPGIRIVPAFVRRIVWTDGDRVQRPYQPGTAFYRDGRQVRFRAIRFADTRIDVLGRTGRVRMEFEELAELHLADRDFWSTYLDELAVLSPTAEETLVQWETVAGSRLSSSSRTFRAYAGASASDPSGWIHGMKPAWSLDTLWIRHEAIWLRRWWPPHQVPLSRLHPAPHTAPASPTPPPLDSASPAEPPGTTPSVPASAETGSGWESSTASTWRRDRNVHGRPLRCGERLYGWGLGVQAESWLKWQLPEAATALRTKVGLDRQVGQGGCIRPRILWGNAARPLYEGPVLVGSDRVVDTGRIALPATDSTSAADARQLVLHVSMAHGDRPRDADPLNIRDLADWLEPVVELDRERLRQGIRERLDASTAREE